MLTLKNSIILLLLFLFNFSFAQTFDQKAQRRLNSLDININNIDLDNQNNYLVLEEILEKDRKRRANKRAGIVLSSLSALTISYGALIYAQNKNQQEGLGQSIGVMIASIGVVELGISIPLFISARKRKKERNNLIQQLNY